MKILVTGSAGFIGSALSIELLNRGDIVVSIDNHNDYYDPKLKEARIARHQNHKNYTHTKVDLENKIEIAKIQESFTLPAKMNENMCPRQAPELSLCVQRFFRSSGIDCRGPEAPIWTQISQIGAPEFPKTKSKIQVSVPGLSMRTRS